MIPKRIVIDTNVCLDLFVFRDPRWSGLYAALQSGAVEAVTRRDCRNEWLAVLNYKHLPLDDTSRSKAIAEFDSLITCLQDLTLPESEVRLPICSDRDDQKFLEVALAAGACVLITKDKALLKLSKRNQRAGRFPIITPQAWTLELCSDATMPASINLANPA